MDYTFDGNLQARILEWVGVHFCRGSSQPTDRTQVSCIAGRFLASWTTGEAQGAHSKTLILWPPHAKSWLIAKDFDAGRDWGQEEKGTTEDEMAGWHHWLDGRESEWTPGVGDGQGGLACCDSWGRKELDMTERLNWIYSRGNLRRPRTQVGEWDREVKEASVECVIKHYITEHTSESSQVTGKGTGIFIHHFSTYQRLMAALRGKKSCTV